MEQFKRFLFLVLIFCAADIMLSVAFVAADDVVKTGQGVYLRYCVGCHGEKGDGKGKAAPLLVVKPRDFTTGIFKFKSTPQGTLPTDEDLIRTITKGLSRHFQRNGKRKNQASQQLFLLCPNM